MLLRRTNIKPWTEEWQAAYFKEEKRLKEIFQEEVIDIVHIGSTSVPFIGYAKPVIDILIVVKDIEKIDLFNEKMKDIGYEPKGENEISGRRYFPKGGDERMHHVHIFQIGNQHIQTHLDFKAYLSEHKEEAKKYGELKVRLAEKFPEDHQLYQDGKQSFVTGLAERAEQWAATRRR
ncbi:GrpB family protein [Evansella halocellulosilytica]|uniref:GrpB family protein n=1 Tax=Evansella halocellulosilytica TaxID=2011013 RepID=UPI0027B8D867|nr:GrpB family protein [Evansella halocellulosilytica]